MESAGSLRALWHCTTRGFLAIRATARHGVLPAEAAVFGLTPGFAEADRCVAGLAGACLAVRTSRAQGADGTAALVAGWSAADPVGRAWLTTTVREFAGPQAAAELAAACAALPAAVRSGPATTPVQVQVQVQAPTPGRGRRVGATGWCDAVLTAGFEDILALVGPTRSADGPQWAAVEAVADTCHRVPYPQCLPPPLRPWLVRHHLRDGWSANSAAGQAWCRKRVDRSGIRGPA
ncbi:hypothetical protein ACFVVX_20420 [Kitasatospora sp. NPDC058170]|uniref:hypothetical protein n=1 Tax=Kitasatospora sp. NPDC058170 TaxID=3346364 RepID=UPI0036DBFFD9